MDETGGETSRRSRFPTTCWTQVMAASQGTDTEVREAIAGLCRAYWYPIYAFIRRRGHAPDAALDLTQEYFSRVLETDLLRHADDQKGHFRAFLKTDCGYFLSHQAERERAQKRGGGQPLISIDGRDAEGRYLLELVDNETPERLLDRAWVRSVLDAVLEILREEYAADGRSRLFDALQSTLSGATREISYTVIGGVLGMTQAAVQQAAYRLRQRFRDLLRHQIADTLDSPDEAAIDAELRELLSAFSR